MLLNVIKEKPVRGCS